MAYKYILKKLKNLIYPSVCPLCNEIIEDRSERICDECKADIPYISSPLCFKCGKEINDADMEYCEDCTKKPKSYIRGFPAMNYVSPVRESVAEFKYHNKSSYADFFSYEILKTHGREIAEIAPEALIPVPVHDKKLKIRGYNQAAVLAKRLSVPLGIRVDEDILKRSINTLPQKLFDPEERQKNLERAFILTEKKVQYKKVMLVDDIYTTGATIEACTKMLKASGIKEIYYTSICIGKGE
ncbi:MAG: ComF family protein [Lachnospiraceae bacterium]|nr:ComF family protein [Lachnospiraceae bacterium]